MLNCYVKSSVVSEIVFIGISLQKISTAFYIQHNIMVKDFGRAIK